MSQTDTTIRLTQLQAGPLAIADWTLTAGEHWTVLGGVGSGKSLLSRLLCGERAPDAGQLEGLPERVIWLSLEQQQDLYERELYRDETDLTDIPDQGTPVRALLAEIDADPTAIDATAELLGLTSLLDRGYRLLSSGEGRRVMLGRALLARPDLLLLEEPFEGLDTQSHGDLTAALGELAATGWRLLLLVGQRQDIPPWATHIALLDHCRLALTGPADSVRVHPDWQATTDLIQAPAPELPPRQSEFQLPHWPADEPLVRLVKGRVAYGDTLQFEDFDWALYPGQHTQIAGPNGCGKSTLLKLVNGDHPQCYVNDLTVFGYRRGRGESIWDIKKHLGYVSTDLQRDYRVSGNVVTAVVSGLTDSIGLYQATGQQELDLALQWLDCVGLADKARHSLRSLSSGEQRLVLIARALIKQPPLLILDEPTLGLDDLNRFRVLAVVERLLRDGPTTLLFVSHRQDEQLALVRQRLVFEPASSGWHIRPQTMTGGEA